MFHHVLVTQSCNRGQQGVATTLSPQFSKFYKQSGSKPPIVPNIEGNEEYGGFIGFKLSDYIKY